ncbi:MAG TPA: uracil-DNA glycosylase family protein [Ktedonobacterales bacterium]
MTRSATSSRLLPLWPPIPPSQRTAERQAALAALHAQVEACRRCVTAGYLTEARPIGATRGRIGNALMLVGQAPGRLSMLHGRPFSGPGGKVLETWLARAGFAPGALRSEIYLSALTRCFPGPAAKGSGDRKPSAPELALCQPYLLHELELVRPRGILVVGGMAISALLGPARLEDVVGTVREREGVRLLALPHPSGVSRWMNPPEHQALVSRALDHLAAWREEWERDS